MGPRIDKLWRIMSESAKETFLSLIDDVPPTASLLLLATEEDAGVRGEVSFREDDFPENFFHDEFGEVYKVTDPTETERREYFRPVFAAAAKPPALSSAAVEAREEEEVLRVVKIKESRKLTEKEEKRLRKKEEKSLRELRIFLR